MTRAPFLVMSFLGVTTATAHAQWGPEVPLTSTGSDVWGEGIATSGSTVHVVYGTNDVRYRSSSNDGADWSAERTIDDGILHLTDPMVADGDDVWVVSLKNIRTLTDWCCARDVGDIYVVHSGNGGQTWDAARRLTTAQGAFRLSIAYANGKLHLVWMDYRSGAWDTYYLRSIDRGMTWDQERVIAQSAGTFGAERPQVAARGDQVHVTIWDDRGTNPPCMAGPTFSFTTCPDTFYMGSLNGGDTWSTEVPVDYSGAAFAGRNDIAVAGASSVVVNFNRAAEGTADANPHMFTVRSSDNGMTWDDPVQLTDTPGSSDHGSIIGRDRTVYLAWHDSRDGALAIYYRHSTTEGATWDPEERTSTTTTTDSSTPLLAVTDGYVHALWLDRRSGTFQIYYRRRTAPSAPTGGDGDPTTDAGGPPGDGDGGGCGCSSSRDALPSALPWFVVAFLLFRRRSAVQN